MFRAQKLKIASIFQVVICSLAFAAVTACGEPQTAKVVNRGNNSGQNRVDEKLAKETGIGLPAFTAISAISLRQVTHALNIVLQGKASDEIDPNCQDLDIEKVDSKTEKFIVKIKPACTAEWSGSEVFTVTYTGEDKKVIRSIVKERASDKPLMLRKKMLGNDRELSIVENFKITRTETDGVYTFSYNEDRLNPLEPDYVLTQTRVMRPGNGRKKLRDNEFNTGSGQNISNNEIDILREKVGGRANIETKPSHEPRGDARIRAGGRRTTNANQVFTNRIYVSSSGTVNIKTSPYQWTIKHLSVGYKHSDSNGDISDSRVLSIAPLQPGMTLVLNECALPIGSFNAAEQEVFTLIGDKKVVYEPAY
jgi:hypothetical protein